MAQVHLSQPVQISGTTVYQKKSGTKCVTHEQSFWYEILIPVSCPRRTWIVCHGPEIIVNKKRCYSGSMSVVAFMLL